MSTSGLYALLVALAILASACGHYGDPVRSGSVVSSGSPMILDTNANPDEECEEDEQP